MAVFYIILRDFTLIDLLFFGEKVYGIPFLQERITLVFFVD